MQTDQDYKPLNSLTFAALSLAFAVMGVLVQTNPDAPLSAVIYCSLLSAITGTAALVTHNVQE